MFGGRRREWPRIAIIGGELGGVAAGVKLRGAGFENVTVFEKSPGRVRGTFDQAARLRWHHRGRGPTRLLRAPQPAAPTPGGADRVGDEQQLRQVRVLGALSRSGPTA
jgi:cation diffusion facilitator CzcD-associated flavoprotein CzcO